MAEFKIVISDPKTGKSYQREAKDDVAKSFLNMKIGYDVKGEVLDLTGYEFKITGGSDLAGFPMRKDVSGPIRKKILAVSGIGMKKKDKGIKQRKTVCGNTITENIVQINMVITKYGKQSLEIVSEEKAEEKPETKKEEAKEEKKEEKKEDTKEDKKEEKKQEVKTEDVAKPEEKSEAKPEENKEAKTENTKEEKKE